MRILVAGSSGQVARALTEARRSDFDLRSCGRPSFDLECPETLVPAIDAFEPELVINAAAYTLVDKAETNWTQAMSINAIGAETLAALAAERGIPILHLSTDYVFSGSKTTPYSEMDSVDPISAYGRSKLEGELRVAAANPQHLILRTSWVHAPYGANFVRTMLRLAGAGAELRVVDDQHGSPSYAPDIAEGLLEIAMRLKNGATSWGTYHMTSAGSCTWADFAELIFEYSAARGGAVAKVNRISTAEYPTAARRPENSRLDCARLLSDYGVALPEWRSGVDRCVARLLERESST